MSQSQACLVSQANLILQSHKGEKAGFLWLCGALRTDDRGPRGADSDEDGASPSFVSGPIQICR